MTTSSDKAAEAAARQLEQAAGESPEAFDQAMDALWPDEGVVVGHTPPAPGDGLMHRAFVTEAHRRVAQAMRAALPDYRYENVSARLDGAVIHFAYDQVGTLADGARIAATITVRLTFRDGRLAEAVSAYDHEQMAPFMTLMASLQPAD